MMAIMSAIVAELYDALRTAGVPDDKAMAAAVVGADGKSELATKADLSELEARLIKWNVGATIAMTAVFAAIVKLL
jgi:hypothetical protein